MVNQRGGFSIILNRRDSRFDPHSPDRHRAIHGGGLKLPDPFAPKQGWRVTHGCTRGQNEDVIELHNRLLEYRRTHPKVRIPYQRW